MHNSIGKSHHVEITLPAKLENPTITGHFEFVVEEHLGRNITLSS